MTALPKRKYSLEEYFEIERNSGERYEYFDGNIWSMAGASPNHERIVSNGIFHLRTILGNGCSVFGSNLKIKVPVFSPYRYPDLSAYCGEGQFEKMGGMEVLTNPQMIVEVLSDSTEAFDRGDKFSYYKSIESFVEYILISTKRPYITQFIKNEDGEWINREAVGLDAKLYSPTFDVEIVLSEIYLNVEFPPDEKNLFLVER